MTHYTELEFLGKAKRHGKVEEVELMNTLGVIGLNKLSKTLST
jgi:hypothetical protein